MKMTKLTMTNLAFLAAVGLGGLGLAHAEAGIQFKAPMAYPEGVAYNPKTGDFFVSSMRHGTVGLVKRDGSYREFAKDPLLISSVGMRADLAHGRLLVCVSDPGVSVKTSPKTQKKIARLLAFDLNSGKRLKAVDLDPLVEGQHFCNDIAVDEEGNVYVTDSFSPVIYRVDSSFKASVLVKSDSFKGEGFNLNGVVYHKDGYLLADKSSDGSLWRIDVKDPSKMSQVTLSEKIPNADGMVWLADGELAVIQNADHRVVELKSTDGWKTAKVGKAVLTEKDFPTTGVFVDGKLYVLLSRLGELFADPTKAKSEAFTLKQVVF